MLLKDLAPEIMSPEETKKELRKPNEDVFHFAELEELQRAGIDDVKHQTVLSPDPMRDSRLSCRAADSRGPALDLKSTFQSLEDASRYKRRPANAGVGAASSSKGK